MPTKRKTATTTAHPPGRNEHDDTESVSAYLNALEHPMKPVIEAIRAAILEADRNITEGIKWNTASFYCYGWFATVNIRAKTGVQLVLHHGAKIRANSELSRTVDDPSHLLTWLAKDRTLITFTSADDFKNRQAAFKKIIKQWTRHQTHLAKTAGQGVRA
jgi:hypothetical protein